MHGLRNVRPDIGQQEVEPIAAFVAVAAHGPERLQRDRQAQSIHPLSGVNEPTQCRAYVVVHRFQTIHPHRLPGAVHRSGCCFCECKHVVGQPVGGHRILIVGAELLECVGAHCLEEPNARCGTAGVYLQQQVFVGQIQ